MRCKPEIVSRLYKAQQDLVIELLPAKMSFDLATLLAITVFSSAIAGCLLLLSWLQKRSVPALALWGLAFLLGAAATVLIAMRGSIPDAWSIILANAVLTTAYGTMWWGVRSFEHRNTRVLSVLAGTLIWLLACSIPVFYATPVARAALMAAIGVSYMGLAVFELWRSRSENLTSRWPIIFLLGAHAAAIPVRIPLVATRTGTGLHADLLAFVVFEAIFLSICGAFLFGGIVKERFLAWYEFASLNDPLTGAANRRAFFEQGNRIVERSMRSRTPVSLLLFDLDEFKRINDRYGHAAGDAVLTNFCTVTRIELRPSDLLARLGGEEFACLLADVSHQEAVWIADRVREAFDLSNGSFGATVSAGVSSFDEVSCDLSVLLANADRALYRAKENGRNRVESDLQLNQVRRSPFPQTA